jgi:hypothetical protein
LNDSLYPFSQGLPGSMNNVPTPILDHLDHLLALTYQNIRLTQFAYDLFRTVTLLRHAISLLDSV